MFYNIYKINLLKMTDNIEAYAANDKVIDYIQTQIAIIQDKLDKSETSTKQYINNLYDIANLLQEDNKKTNKAFEEIDKIAVESTYKMEDFKLEIRKKLTDEVARLGDKLKEFENSIQKLVLNQANLTNSLILLSSQLHDLENRMKLNNNK